MASGETKGVMINDSASSFDAAAISVSLTAFIVAYFVFYTISPTIIIAAKARSY
ncbi:hypothetical protein [Vibrio caribbeanicus]|uniref:Uncharacterized protein n=1 Tax=Vibrio caribbeanicus ATCC BAA-2122 TaxID=796620 RepID=E3BJT8_9VIBR|nr:hypothetical protein [Vibrio caribbeanicus]EFP96857.1 hypothetical protein VIBC2010_07804 [Vibrio caribbeanicus ATCC BAA-2122]